MRPTTAWLLAAILLSVYGAAVAPATIADGGGTPDPVALRPRGPILIEGDGAFLSDNGVVAGMGTIERPYIIEGWEIDAAGATGITIRNATAHFTIRDTVVLGPSGEDGIRLEDVRNGRIANVTTLRVATGLALREVANLSVEASTFRDALPYGLRAESGTNVTIEGVDATGGCIHLAVVTRAVVQTSVVGGGPCGISTVEVLEVAILDNAITGSVTGVNVSTSESVLVAGNRIEGDPTQAGVGVLVGGSDTVFVRNNVVTANDIGISLIGSRTSRVFHNRVFANALPAMQVGGAQNLWDYGYPEGGNDWDDYDGFDDCRGLFQNLCPGSDGLGDTPYLIQGEVRDRYPLVDENPFNALPVPAIVMPSGPHFAGLPIWFDLAGTDPDGRVVQYAWDFGDGTQGRIGTEPPGLRRHVYGSPGVYHASLALTDDRYGEATASARIEVVPLTFVPYAHASGIRVPMPVSWFPSTDETVGDAVLDIVLRGPHDREVQATVTVASDHGSNTAAPDALRALVEAFLERARTATAGVELVDEPDFIRIADRMAVVFELRAPSTIVVQRVAIVLSDARDRSWTVVLTTTDRLYEATASIYGDILAGLQIGGDSRPSTLLPVLGAGAVVGAVGAVARLLGAARNRSLGRGQDPDELEPASRSPPVGPRPPQVP